MRLFKKNFETYSDEELMISFQKGNRKAFEEIYHRYSDHLVNFFYQKLWQNRNLAEDQTQDLFSIIIYNPYLFDTTKKFKPWVFTIAYNMCKNAYKKHDVRKNTKYEIPNDNIINDQLILADELLDEHNFKNQLDKELELLNEKQREVFVLKHSDGLTSKEIAEMLGISEGTVKSRLHYATKHLAKQLIDYKTIIS